MDNTGVRVRRKVRRSDPERVLHGEDLAGIILGDRKPSKMFQIRLPNDTHTWLKLRAAADNTTMSNIVVGLLDLYRKKTSNPIPEI